MAHRLQILLQWRLLSLRTATVHRLRLLLQWRRLSLSTVTAWYSCMHACPCQESPQALVL